MTDQADIDYQAVCDWTRERLDDWTTDRKILPRVRHRDLEVVGTLGFDAHTKSLVLRYTQRIQRRQLIFPKAIAAGHVQVKVGARYVDIREVIAEHPDGVIV